MTVNNLRVTVQTGHQCIPMHLANASASIDAHLRFPPNIIPQFPLMKWSLVSLNGRDCHGYYKPVWVTGRVVTGPGPGSNFLPIENLYPLKQVVAGFSEAHSQFLRHGLGDCIL
ncbi:hypothetical protein EDB84DRAFT_1439535 [Lactarius hengduanensis]|nr:hypothetical protein EDB84DRAFT_1439535 [Lactarius hengduanensis]